jgi:hypothetical protein
VPPWTTSVAQFSGHFWTLGLHLGVSAAQGNWVIGGEVGPFIEEISLGGPALIQNSRIDGGARGALVIRRSLGSHFQLMGGIEFGVRSGTTTVNIEGAPALTLPPLFAALRLGVAFPLDP